MYIVNSFLYMYVCENMWNYPKTGLETGINWLHLKKNALHNPESWRNRVTLKFCIFQMIGIPIASLVRLVSCTI